MVDYHHSLNFTNDVPTVANSLSFLPTAYSLQSLVFIDLDDMQTAFVTHYSYGFDLDMMNVRDGQKNLHSTDLLMPPHQRSM